MPLSARSFRAGLYGKKPDKRTEDGRLLGEAATSRAARFTGLFPCSPVLQGRAVCRSAGVLARPVVPRVDRPSRRPALAIGQVQRLLLAEAAHVLQAQRQEVSGGGARRSVRTSRRFARFL